MPTHLARNAEMTRLYSLIGGTEALTNAYAAQIKAAGGKLRLGCAITRITAADGRATGVVDEKGKTHACDLVMASGGAKETLLGLLEEGTLPTEFAEKVANIPLMDSVFMLHLGVDYDPSPVLRSACTYFYGSYDIEGEVERARKGLYHEGEAGFVVHWPTLRSPEMAPRGKHALTIYTICPDRLAAGDWEKDKKKYAEKLLDHAEKRLPGLRKHIVEQVIVAPPDFRKLTHLEHHAFGGIAPLLGAWKVPHQTPVQGLWFIGAQSESGGGVNSVIPAAYRAAKKAGGK
jgi:phytoene dehydrogenase-like protein